MSEELTVGVEKTTLVPADVMGSKDMTEFQEIAKSSGFLPYIQLMGSSSAQVKEGTFPIGHYALMKDQSPVDLGDNFIALLVAWRPKAMQWGDDVVSIFDMKDPLFQEIKAQADTPGVMGSGYGPEYLVWLPEQMQFATYFLSNPTGRREAGNFQIFLGNTCRIKSRLIKGKKHTWHGPQVAAYSGDIQLPNWVESATIIDTFKNPPKPELAEETDGERER